MRPCLHRRIAHGLRQKMSEDCHSRMVAPYGASRFYAIIVMNRISKLV